MQNETLSQMQEASRAYCKTNMTLNCFSNGPSSEHKFALSISIMILPYIFYLYEVINKYRAKYLTVEDINMKLEKDFEPPCCCSLDCFKRKYLLWQNAKKSISLALKENWYTIWIYWIIMTLVWIGWPLVTIVDHFLKRIYFFGSSSHRKVDRHSERQRRSQECASRAHLIEVCTEASLQPLLQFYLLLPTLIRLGSEIDHLLDLSLINLADTSAIQFYSVVGSVASMAFSFTTYYRKKKQDAMGICEVNTIIYFFYALCLVLSRLLSFVVFAYFFQPYRWYIPACCVAIHFLLMAFLDFLLSNKENWNWKQFDCQLLYYCVLNGLANIFVHNQIDIFRPPKYRTVVDGPNVDRQPSRNPEKSLKHFWNRKTSDPRSTFKRQLIFDAVFGIEIGIMLAFAFLSELYQRDSVYQTSLKIMTIVICCLFFFGLVLKIAYYSACHLWSDLICQCTEMEEDYYGTKYELANGTSKYEDYNLMEMKPMLSVPNHDNLVSPC